MPERWVGFAVVGDVVTVVDAQIPDNEDDPVTILADDTWKLQQGDRVAAYDVMYRRCASYLKENEVEKVIVKASALTMGSTKLSHMTSAELRGVILAAAGSPAAGSLTSVKTMAKAHVSRTYGDRNMDDYVKDDSFWIDKTTGCPLRKSSREAAMILIAARNG